MAQQLVERGADVDKLDAVSEPALWHAVEQGHGQMVALLLKLGATASDLPCPPGKVRRDRVNRGLGSRARAPACAALVWACGGARAGGWRWRAGS